MPAQIRPNRLEVTDRFPMLAFSLSCTDGPRLAEVVLASDIALFNDPAARNSANFYSSREHGVLAIPANGSVYTVPPQVMARFIAANRIYFGLATASAPGGQDWRVDAMPGEASPYVSLSGLTDRALRRVRMFPVAPRGGAVAPTGGASWIGDTLQSPAPVADAPTAPTEATTPAPVPYNDGFGPLEPLAPDAAANGAAPAAAPAPDTAPATAAQGLGLATGRELGNEVVEEYTSSDAYGIDGPTHADDAPVVAQALRARQRSPLTQAEYPGVTRIMASPHFRRRDAGARTIDRIVIHITSTPQRPSLGSGFMGERVASAHYLVDQLGGIIQFVREQDDAFHARRANSRSIGIEHVAVQQGGARYGSTVFPYDPPTQIELETSAALVAHLCRKYGLEPNRTTIVGHNEIDTGTTHTACPVGAWDWDPYMVLVANCYANTPAGGVVGPVISLGLSQAEIDPETQGIDAAPYSDEPAPAVAAGLSLTAREYDRVSRIVASPAFTAGRSGTAIDRIVIHITDAPTTSSTVNHFSSPSARASAHYLVGQNGEIVQFVSEADTAWHARGANRRSIGIEHVAIKAGGADYPRRNGTMQHYDALPPTQLQYEESALLVSHLCEKYGLPKTRTTIIGHNEADPNTTHTSCPVGNWDWDYFMRIVETGQCQADPPAAQGLARALEGGNDTVEIKYRAFIPSPALSGPFIDNYHGDGRGFSYSSGTSRGELTCLVDMSSGGGLSNLRYSDRHWSDSHSYSSSDTTAVPGKPDWWLDLNPGAVPTGTAACALNDDTLRAFIGGSGTTVNVLAVAENASLVTVWMAGNNPLIPGSPDIDATMAVLLRRTASGGIEAKVHGSHDGFPAHELYVNGHQLYTYDPVAAGNGPTALIAPEDIDVSTGWTTVSAGATSQGLTSDQAGGTDPDDGEIAGAVHDIDPPAAPATAAALDLTAAEFPGARVMVSPNYTRGRAGQTIDRIVIHITSSVQSPHLGSWFQNPASRASAHYMVDQLGAVRQFVAEADTAWHAGNRAMNRRSIGIEHVAVQQGGMNYTRPNGTVQHFDYLPPSDIEYTTSAGLVASLCRKYNLTPDRTTIIGHAEANPSTTHTACPNGAWDWDRYMGLVTAAYAVQATVDAVGSGVNAVRNAIGLSGGESWTINWDDVERIPQPTEKGCWATAAAMILGWRDRQSVSPELLASCNGMDSSLQGGLAPSNKRAFINAVGLVVHPNACYTPEGFRDILEANGPVWVTADVPGIHAIVVTGMYYDGSQYCVRITDPWDRVVGSPGAPGSYATTHSTGSQYIMTYDAFTAEFEAAGDIDRIQLAHAGGTHGHTINRGSAAGAGYALGLARQLGDDTAKPAIVPPSPPTPAPGPVELVQTREAFISEGRDYDLAQMAGLLRPSNALAGGAGMPPIPGQRVVLNEWPYIEEAGNRTSAPVAIDWKFDGAAVGDVAIVPEGGAVHNGRTVRVRADIEPCPGTPNRAELLVRVTTTFSKAGEPDEVAVSEVTLGGDGMTNTRHAGTQPAAAPAPAPAAPPAASPAPAAQPQPAMA